MSTGEPLVSVCMPAHRDSHWFRAALQSVRAQSYREVELIVTDDSGGQLRAPAEAAGARYVANRRRLGFSGNHCRGLAEARGEFVAFLHDDDLWHPRYLEHAVAALRSHPTVGLVFGGVEEIDADDAPLGTRPARMDPGIQPEPVVQLTARDFMLMLPSAATLRRGALPEVSAWPDVITGDMVMYLDAVVAGWDLWFEPAAIAYHRTHPGQVGNHDVALRTGLVEIWDRYRFERHDWERARTRRLAETLVARAGALVKEGRGSAARSDLHRAVRLSSSSLGVKSVAIAAASFSAPAARLALRVWGRVHDPVATRHDG